MITIPARGGKADRIRNGQVLTVINTHGEQVVDTWAFAATDIAEFMSMEHSRAAIRHLRPAIGDSLVSNHRRPMLTVVEDTVGVHDMLMAACDRYRYEQLGHVGYHDSCTDNLAKGLAELGLSSTRTPSPLNLFMNIPWTPSGELSFEPPRSRPGDLIRLRAEMDLIVAFSACPQDLLPINGIGRQPTEAHYQIS